MSYGRIVQHAWALVIASFFVSFAAQLHAEPITAELTVGVQKDTPPVNLVVLGERWQFKKNSPNDTFSGTTWEKAKDYLFISEKGNAVAVLDADKADAEKPDVLKVNFTGKQDFAASDVLRLPLNFKKYGETDYSRIDLTETPLTIGGKACKALVSAIVSMDTKNKHTYLMLQVVQVAWAKVDINGKTNTILIASDSPYADFPAPNDKSKIVATLQQKNMMAMNRVLLGLPMNINGKWFTLSLADNGKKLAIADYTGPMGKLSWPDGMKTVLLCKGCVDLKSINKMPDSIFTLVGGKNEKSVDLPTGEYTVVSFNQTIKGKSGQNEIQITASIDLSKATRPIDVVADKVAKICDDSLRLTILPELKVSGHRVMMESVAVKGIDNMRVDVSSLAQKIAIYSATDDKLVHEGKLEYG